MNSTKLDSIALFLSMNRYAAKMTDTLPEMSTSSLNLSDTGFISFFEQLNGFSIRYLITGNLAAAYYGCSKISEGIELWVFSEHIDRLQKDLSLIVSPYHERKIQQVKSAGEVFPLFPISNLTYFPSKEFNYCYSRASLVEYGGHSIPIMALDDLIIEKIASGTVEDHQISRDLERIKRMKNL